MTAIGFVLLVVGALLINLFGTGLRWSHNRADTIGVVSAGTGCVLIGIGVVRWLWRVMP